MNEYLFQKSDKLARETSFAQIDRDISVLKGKIIKRIWWNESSMNFLANDGSQYAMLGDTDGNLSYEVFISNIDGELTDLYDVPIELAEMAQSNDGPTHERCQGYHTWTFYKLATIRGYVTIRWYGTSNGHYSEEVDFVEIVKNELQPN